MKTFHDLLSGHAAKRVAVTDPINPPSMEFLGALAEAGHHVLVYGDAPGACGSLADAFDAVGQEVDVIVNGATEPSRFFRLLSDWTKKKNPKAFLSTVAVLERPTKTLLVTDLTNPRPSLAEKVSILANAAKVASALGIEKPAVAAVTAVEKVDPVHQPATVDAAALSKMSAIGQIKGMIVDGPMALDIAMSEHSAQVKGVSSPVAGKADVLLAPDAEAASIMADTLELCAWAHRGQVIVGTVPVGFVHPTDTAASRFYSLALALSI
ncbi:MAG: phosphate acyltransferase [Bacteroidota bacterium]